MSETDANDTTADDTTADDTTGDDDPSISTSDDSVELSDTEREQIEADRQERLDPENRPTNAEVDNSPREWDALAEDFTYGPDEIDGGPTPGADLPDDFERDTRH